MLSTNKNKKHTRKTTKIAVVIFFSTFILLSTLSCCIYYLFQYLIDKQNELAPQFLFYLQIGLLILTLTASVCALIGTLLSSHYTRKPIEQLIKKIKSINTDNLHYRIPESSTPIEYISLVRAFNNIIAHIEEIFNRQYNFTADIAHEIRTPITTLATQTQISLTNARTIDEYKEILYSNLEEYEHLSQMINDMLFLAKADNGQLTKQLSNIDWNQIFLTMFEFYEPLCEEKKIAIKLEGYCPDMLGDQAMINRAISNLLSNAIRHTPENNTILITLSVDEKKRINITISNPGKMIDAKHLPHLFKRFYRPDESKRRNGEGAGIGLAIVKSIVEAHHGVIRAQSDQTSTRFIMIFPITNKNNILR